LPRICGSFRTPLAVSSRTLQNAGLPRDRAEQAELQSLEQRFVGLEQLVLLIAQQVGLAPDAITRLLPPAAPPT